MSGEQPRFEDWVNAVARPVIGLLLGLALGAIIKIFAEDGLVMAVIAGAVSCLVWFGMLGWRKLEEGFGNFLFGGPGVRARRGEQPPNQSLPARVGRHGLPVGMGAGCLVELLSPQSVLGMVV